MAAASLLHFVPVDPTQAQISALDSVHKSNADALESKLGSAYIEGPPSPKAGLGTLAERGSLWPLVSKAPSVSAQGGGGRGLVD